jgi:hypothetical protein
MQAQFIGDFNVLLLHDAQMVFPSASQPLADI